MDRIRIGRYLPVLLVGFMLQTADAFAGARFNKVVTIVFENTHRDKVLKQSDFMKFAKMGALLKGMRAATHPSQPNYIMMVAGDTLGVNSNKNYDLSNPNIADLLEPKGLTWKSYSEGFPGNCFLGATSGRYARKHSPFMSFKTITGNPTRCANNQTLEHFFEDINRSQLPNYSFVVPNLDNDAHDTDIDHAGRWLTQNFGPLLESAVRGGDTLYVLTFDEDNGSSPTNDVYTVLIGPAIRAGVVNNQVLNHGSLLRMIEDEFQLNRLGTSDTTSPIIEGIWKSL